MSSDGKLAGVIRFDDTGLYGGGRYGGGMDGDVGLYTVCSLTAGVTLAPPSFDVAHEVVGVVAVVVAVVDSGVNVSRLFTLAAVSPLVARFVVFFASIVAYTAALRSVDS